MINMASDHFALVKLSCSNLFTSGLVFLMIVALCNFSRLRQAFDKMSHPHLLGKLQQYRIKGQLLKWISDFLTTRRRRVVNRWPFLRLVGGNIWRASGKYFETFALSRLY